MKHKTKIRSTLVAVLAVVLVAFGLWFLRQRDRAGKLTTVSHDESSMPSPVVSTSRMTPKITVITNQSMKSGIPSKLDRAKELIRNLRYAASKVADVQALCVANVSILEELRSLGNDAITACLDEIADRTSPVSLRILLIEIASSLNERNDPRLGQALMSLISDTTDVKAVRMQALQWIPQAGDQSTGIFLVQMLPNERDADLEFGITRALRGFKVPGSVEVLKSELAEDKGHLIRLAASHAIASQGGQDALAVLQASVSMRSTAAGRAEGPEETAVTMHKVLALGELPDHSSVPILEPIFKDSDNAVSVRSTAAETIGKIGGLDATRVLRHALLSETNESVLVYIARGLLRCGNASDALQCVQRVPSVSDIYTRSELERIARELQGKESK